MNLIQSTTAHITVAVQAIRGRFGVPVKDRERGDVPGWVLITLMTAGLVTVLWALAGGQLEAMFTAAMRSVTGPGRS